MSILKKEKKSDKLRIDFLPEALEIIEKPASPLAHFIIWVVIFLVVSFLIWSIVGRVDETANAMGQVITVDGIQTVQSVNGGVISELFVKEGEKIESGDILFKLEDKIVNAQLEQNQSNYYQLQFKNYLLNKVLEGDDINLNLDEITSDKEKEIVKQVMALIDNENLAVQKGQEEVETYEKQVQIEKSSLSLLESQKESLIIKETNLKSFYTEKGVEEVKLEVLQSQLAELNNEIEIYQKLYDSDAIPEVDLENKKKEITQIEAEISLQQIVANKEKVEKVDEENSLKFSINENAQEITIQSGKVQLQESNLEVAQVSIEGIKASSRENILTQIEQYNKELGLGEVALVENNTVYENTVIKAPCSGTVQMLYVNTVGEALEPTQIMAEIVPNESQLIFEASLSNQDVGFIELEQEANIKLDTYNYQKFGKWNGEVIYISPDAIEDEKMGLVYKVKIALDKNSFKDNQNEVEIVTGMKGTAEIQTGEKRIVEFFLEPLVDVFDGSLTVR